MRNHQEHQHHQEIIAPMDSQEHLILETTTNHHHVMVPMDSNKNPNLETNPNHVPPSPSSSQDFKRTHHQHTSHVVKKTNVDDDQGFISKKSYDDDDDVSCSWVVAGGDMATPPPPQEESGRERLKRHRVEMAGRVWIPDIWGHEHVLKDWIDCTVFDSSLGNNTIMSARAALVHEGRSTLRIQNRCS